MKINYIIGSRYSFTILIWGKDINKAFEKGAQMLYALRHVYLPDSGNTRIMPNYLNSWVLWLFLNEHRWIDYFILKKPVVCKKITRRVQ